MGNFYTWDSGPDASSIITPPAVHALSQGHPCVASASMSTMGEATPSVGPTTFVLAIVATPAVGPSLVLISLNPFPTIHCMGLGRHDIPVAPCLHWANDPSMGLWSGGYCAVASTFMGPVPPPWSAYGDFCGGPAGLCHQTHGAVASAAWAQMLALVGPPPCNHGYCSSGC